VRGKESDLTSEQSVQEFRTLVPHAEYVDVSRAGHMIAGDNNDAFTNAVIDFITRQFPVMPSM
jgi:pimeloyl-ACP methyl ester carboxylesterase